MIQKGGTPITNTNDLGLYSHTSGNWIRMVTNNAPIRFFSGIGDGGKGSSLTMTIEPTGAVGIGTPTPSEKLEVNGTIRSREVKVEASPWPDYVFADDYRIPSLQETADYIREHKHLPGIPSAAEVQENGISLGEMNAKLLEKVEELTLHVIKQDEVNVEIRASNQIQEDKIEELTRYILQQQKELEDLKAKLNE